MTSLLHNKDVNDILYRTWREVLLHCGAFHTIRCSDQNQVFWKGHLLR